MNFYFITQKGGKSLFFTKLIAVKEDDFCTFEDKIIQYSIDVQKKYSLFNLIIFLGYLIFTYYFNYLVQEDIFIFSILCVSYMFLEIFFYLLFIFFVPNHTKYTYILATSNGIATFLICYLICVFCNEFFYDTIMYNIVLSSSFVLIFPDVYILLLVVALFLDMSYFIFLKEMTFMSDEFFYNVLDALVMYFLSANFNLIFTKVKFSEFTARYKIDLENKTDILTTLLNRRGLEQDIFKSKLVNSNTLCAMSFMDLDNFKDINDNFGHLDGDELLKNIAVMIQDSFKNCTIARIGGDEFVVYADNLTSSDEFLQLNKNFMKLFPLIITKNNVSVPISCSIGIVFANTDTSNLYEKLYKLSDECMYKAKNDGKNTFCISYIGGNFV